MNVVVCIQQMKMINQYTKEDLICGAISLHFPMILAKAKEENKLAQAKEQINLMLQEYRIERAKRVQLEKNEKLKPNKNLGEKCGKI